MESDKSLAAPFARAPATEENDTADVLIEGEAYPHAYKAIAEGNADDIAQTDGNAPLEDNAHDEGIDGVACSTKRTASEDVRRAAYLKEHIDHKHPNAHLDDFLVVGKSTEDARSCQSKQDGTC